MAVPHIFTPLTPALSAEVNENFAFLVDAIGAAVTRLDKLEGRIVAADLVGRYTFLGFENNMFATSTLAPDQGIVENAVYRGTVELKADGTATWSQTEYNNRMRWVLDPYLGGTTENGSPLADLTTTLDYRTPATSGDATWSLTAGELMLQGMQWSGVAGGRLFVAVGTTAEDGSSDLFLMVRQSS